MRVLALGLFAIGCAASPPSDRPPTAPSPGWRAQAETRAEIALGERIDQKLATRFGFYGERRVNAYVRRIGQRVANGAERRDIEYAFTVIDDPSVNAFAVPGGYIYVTRGLLAHLGSEAELAAVLAHEVAHVDRRHALGEQAWEQDRAPSLTGADAVRFYERSRDNEREADALAIRQLTRLGYDPAAMRTVLERLGRVERELIEHDGDSEDDERGWLSSHPATVARIARAAYAIGALTDPPGKRGIDAYFEAIDGISYGENPRRAFVADGAWVLPDERLSFAPPRGWESSGSAQAFSASRPDGAAVVILMRMALGELEPSEHTQTTHREIAGRRAIWMSVDVDSDWAGRVGLIDLGVEQLLLIATARRNSAGVVELDQLPSRFRLLSGRVREPRPLRLRVVRAAHGATLAELGRSSPIPRAELARVNGMSETARLNPGSSVKFVSR
jgi:predicted Zn-dependent protease